MVLRTMLNKLDKTNFKIQEHIGRIHRFHEFS
nr:MAG TPA: hypothetical protein [Caudoviricetes sp.]